MKLYRRRECVATLLLWRELREQECRWRRRRLFDLTVEEGGVPHGYVRIVEGRGAFAPWHDT